MTAESLVRPQEAAPSASQVREQVRQQLRQNIEQLRVSQEQAQVAREQAQVAREQAQAAADAARAAGLPAPPAPPAAPESRVIRIGPQGVIVDRPGQTRSVIGVGPDGTVQGPPVKMVENIAQSFFVMVAVIALGVPLLRLVGRWMDRRHAAPPALPADLTQRLERIEQAVDTIAIEVERISEGQRFTSKLLAEMGQRPQLVGAERVPSHQER